MVEQSEDIRIDSSDLAHSRCVAPIRIHTSAFFLLPLLHSVLLLVHATPPSLNALYVRRPASCVSLPPRPPCHDGRQAMPPSLPLHPLELHATEVGATTTIFQQVKWLFPSLALSPLRSGEVDEIPIWILAFFFFLILQI